VGGGRPHPSPSTVGFCFYLTMFQCSSSLIISLFNLDQRQRGQLYTALKNGFASILRFLQDLSTTLRHGVPSAKQDSPAANLSNCVALPETAVLVSFTYLVSSNVSGFIESGISSE